jgi:hypothetical protein
MDTDTLSEPLTLSFLQYIGGNIQVDQTRLIEFLSNSGFAKYYESDNPSSSLVRKDDSFLWRTSREKIKDFVVKQIEHIPENELPNNCSHLDLKAPLIESSNVYLSRDKLEFLPEVNPKLDRDTKRVSFFYFQNGYVRATSDDIELKEYSDLDGVVWRDQVIHHKFRMSDTDPLESDWMEFLRDVTGGETDRLNALTSAIGYLLHGHKDPTEARAIIFMDQAISDVASGRTGKSLVAESLQKLVPVNRIDARNFSFGSQFSFQSVKTEHQVIDFNDASKDFNFKKLFSAVTDDIQVERKYEDEITIPFNKSPKFIISTNHVIEGGGSSFEDRVFRIEFAPYYSEDYCPNDKFEYKFFNDWSDKDWNVFYELMIHFARQYISSGLQAYDQINIKKRELRQKTSNEFAKWILNQDPGEYQKSRLFDKFKKDMGDNYVFSGGQKKFTRLCNEFGRIYTGEKLPASKSGAKRFITIPNINNIEQG